MGAAPDEETVSVRREDAVAVVELRRERKLNALSTAMEERLDAAVASAEVRESRCVVFTGGPRAFSAGADVTEFRDADAASVAAYYAGSGGVYERIARLPQPTLAAISGYCLGGGLELALATDIRIADASADFGLPEVGLGIIPSSGGVLRLTARWGPPGRRSSFCAGAGSAPPRRTRSGWSRRWPTMPSPGRSSSPPSWPLCRRWPCGRRRRRSTWPRSRRARR